jgi:hypothetical protein
MILLQRSVSVRSRAEVIVTHMPSTSDVCETHAQSVEKPIPSLATSALLTHVVNILGSSLRSPLSRNLHYAGLADERFEETKSITELYQKLIGLELLTNINA